MKLRNKKTGEIVDLSEGMISDTYDGEKIEVRSVANSDNEVYVYSSLAELNEEWEDSPEEPKGYWYIDDVGVIQIDQALCSVINMRKSIGNFFNTREEAEKAVEKLRAYKRLKDKGFSFHGYDDGYDHDFNSGHIEFYVKNSGDVLDDLDLLFGGEE